MTEPIDLPQPLHAPFGQGGWPRACLVMQLDDGVTLDQAVHDLADASRRLRVGVVAMFAGAELRAYPHQRTDEIRRSFHTFQGLRAKAEQQKASA